MCLHSIKGHGIKEHWTSAPPEGLVKIRIPKCRVGPCESAFLTKSQMIWTMLVWDHALSSVVKEDSPPPSAWSTMIPNSWPSHTHLSLTSACPSACIKASAYALSSIISFNPSLQCSPFTLHYLAGLSSSKSLSHPNTHTQTHTHTRYSLILLFVSSIKLPTVSLPLD